MVIALEIIVDARVVVALRALEVHAEKHPAEIARHEVRLGFAVEIETCGGAKLLVAAVRAEDFACELVQWLVRSKGAEEERAPFLVLDVLLSATLHQHHVEHRGEMPRVSGAGEQTLDELRAFVGRGVIKERASRVGGRRRAHEIEMNAPEEIGIAGERRRRTAVIGFDGFVYPFAQRLRSGRGENGYKQPQHSGDGAAKGWTGKTHQIDKLDKGID